MAFDTQIQDLIGTFTDQAAMDTWMGDGAKEIINVMPDGLRVLCASEATFTSGTPNTLNTGKVLFITRNDGTIDKPCRNIPALLAGRAADTVDMQYASATEPAFFIKNNTIDVLPASGACKYSEVQYPTVDASADSAIAVFPDEAEYLVVLYASIKALQQLMTAKHGNTNITASFTKLNDALTNATASANAAVAKFENANSESVFGDESTFLTDDSQLTRVKNALDAAENVVNNNQPSSDTDAFGAQANEDVEIVSSALNIAQTEIRRAQAHLSEWTAIGDMRVKEINAYLSTAQGHASEIQARLNVDNTEYSWYEKQQQKLQADYDKGLKLLMGGE